MMMMLFILPSPFLASHCHLSTRPIGFLTTLQINLVSDAIKRRRGGGLGGTEKIKSIFQQESFDKYFPEQVCKKYFSEQGCEKYFSEQGCKKRRMMVSVSTY